MCLAGGKGEATASFCSESGVAAEGHSASLDQPVEQLGVLKRALQTACLTRSPPVLRHKVGPRAAPHDGKGSLTRSSNITGAAWLLSTSSASSTAYPLRTNSSPISSF